MPELSMGLLFSGLFVGLLGLVLFLSGKRSGEPTTLCTGIALSALPICIHSVAILWGVTAGVVGGLILLRRFGSGFVGV
ncbi:MAG: hypothetical protein AAFX05_12620 [Planctomycetota bacterium]